MSPGNDTPASCMFLQPVLGIDRHNVFWFMNAHMAHEASTFITIVFGPKVRAPHLRRFSLTAAAEPARLRFYFQRTTITRRVGFWVRYLWGGDSPTGSVARLIYEGQSTVNNSKTARRVNIVYRASLRRPRNAGRGIRLNTP